MADDLRIACIPVSWPTGLGEYSRLLTIAQHARVRWPAARFRFVLNRHAEIEPPHPFEASFLETSPTLDTKGVISVLEEFRPQLVLFDNTGQIEQLRCARRLGARIVCLSSRWKTRWPAMSLALRRLADEHWIVDPPVGVSARLARRAFESVLGTSRLRYLESLYAPPDANRSERLIESLGLSDAPYVLLIAGGGGGRLDDRWSVDVFAEAAARVRRETGMIAVLAQGPLYRGPRLDYPGVRIETSLCHHEIVDLIERAALVVAGASSTSFQALAQRKVVVASSTGGEEQTDRVRRWARARICEPASPDPASLSAAAIGLLRDPERFHAIEVRVHALALRNGLDQALDSMERLLPRAHAAHAAWTQSPHMGRRGVREAGAHTTS